MNYIAMLLSFAMVVIPVTDTGTGTPSEYNYTNTAYQEETAGRTASLEISIIEADRNFEKSESTNEPSDIVQCTDAQCSTSFDEKGYFQYVTWREIEMLAFLVDNEIGGGTRIEKEAVVWCVLNRLDSDSYDFRHLHSVTDVLTQRFWSASAQKWVYQFRSYYGTGSQASIDIVVDVITAWCMEKQSGYPIDTRCLPRDYLFYSGDGKHNYFRNNCYAPYTVWQWEWTGGY